MTLPPRVKFALDLLPLAAFFAGFKLAGLMPATVCLMLATAISLGVTYAAERRLALTPLITALVVGIFGGLTLWLNDERWIKMKPTLVNLIFAAILLGGCATRRGLLRHLLHHAFRLSERGWFLLSRRWGFFFLFLAALNELAWRTLPTASWVNFKVFGILGLSFLFGLLQARLVERHRLPDGA